MKSILRLRSTGGPRKRFRVSRVPPTHYYESGDLVDTYDFRNSTEVVTKGRDQNGLERKKQTNKRHDGHVHDPSEFSTVKGS